MQLSNLSKCAYCRLSKPQRLVNVEALASNFGLDGSMRLLEMFLNETPGILSDAAAALTTQDLPRLRTIMHELQGCCSTISMEGMAGLAKQLSESARAGAWDRAEQFLMQLKRSFEEAQQEIFLTKQMILH